MSSHVFCDWSFPNIGASHICCSLHNVSLVPRLSPDSLGMRLPKCYAYTNELRASLTQAFKQWVPSLSEGDVNIVLSAKNSATSGLVNIISYDLLVRMVSEVQEKKFRAIIAVSDLYVS